MGRVVAIIGSYSYVKNHLLKHCFEHFEEEQIWIVDSLQFFDPYALSRGDITRTRAMLDAIKIARPFTFHQLVSKVYSFTKIKPKNATLIISGFDFEDSVAPKEKNMLLAAIFTILKQATDNGCTVFVGMKNQEFLHILKQHREVEVWEEQFVQLGMK